MKIKSILGSCLVAATMAVSSVTVFAADDAMTLGAPLDMNGDAITGDITSGEVILVPIDITSSKTDGTVDNFSAKLRVTDSLSLGATLKKAELNNLSSLGNGTVYSSSDSGSRKYYAIENVFTLEDGEKYPIDNSVNGVGLNSEKDITITYAKMDTPLSDEPELYAIFTATQDITLDELNKELIESTSNNEVNVTMNAVVNSLKANATQGAFKVVLDADALPAGNWVQGLYAQVGSTKQKITACVHADGTTTYEFPVRVNSATGATNAIDVDIYATTTADEAGATTSTDKKIGSINLTMDGTVTSYTTVDGTIAK